MWLIGTALFATLFSWVVLSSMGDRWGVLIDPNSMIFVIAGILAVLLLSHRKDTWSAVYRCLCSQAHILTPQERSNVAGFMHTGSRAALAFGILGQVLGLMVILMNMDDPAKIGPGMAMALLTLFYGIIISEIVFNPLYKRFAGEPEKGKSPSVSRAPLYMSLAVTGFIIASFWVCMTSVTGSSCTEQRREQTMDVSEQAFGYDKDGVLVVSPTGAISPAMDGN
ncbi:MAG: MotA/TolQ/ExbB proton channel family protein [Sedimentisphaerales bacterium]|nr:MotA/TolQ/ExbB proton channel family protein [Sedimentisphaerales bacterium]